MSLNSFFNPKAIAVIGASNKKHKLGRQILDNIIKGGFGGNIYPINLKEKRIANLKAYTNINEVPISRPTSLLVVIAIPAKFVVAEVKKCADLGIKNLIIISAGFKESGSTGEKLEKEISQIAKKFEMNILGPNCLGFVNTISNLNATFAKTGNQTGNIALLSQSGAIGSAMLDWLQEKNINLGYFLSLGNKTVTNENDILEYLINDPKVDLVGIYLEEISAGQEFMNLASRLAKKKPVVVLKAGQSLSGKKLAQSHTGSLAGSNKAIKAGLTRAGAIYLESLEELFNLCLLSKKNYWRKQGSSDLHLITNAGGLAVISADEISRQNLTMGDSFDVLGDAPASHYQKVLKSLLDNRRVNNVLVMLTPQTSTEPLKTAQVIVRLAKKYPNKLIMTSFVGGQAITKAKKTLLQNNIPSFDFPEEAIQGFKRLIDYRKSNVDLKTYYLPTTKPKRKIKDTDYLKSLALLKKYNIKTVKTLRFSPKIFKSLKYPVVAKVVGPNFIHKSDKKAVVVGIENKNELKKTINKLNKDHRKKLINQDNYLVVQPEINKAQEIILGIKRDSSFGPLVVIGLGGIYAEIFKEIKIEIADLNLNKAKEIIKSLKIYPILNGARGQKKYDVSELARALVKLARLANEHPEIKELDINPLFIREKGVLAGDVRIIV